MNRIVRMAVRFCLLVLWTGTSRASDAPWLEQLFTGQSRPPHPAVVRVIVPNRGSMSLGSGALVAVSEQHGLVVTNWHVVHEAAGPITVVFPDGFRSPATLLKTDENWDLAALAVWRPRVNPIPLSSQPPRPGESLTIAGYGSGDYREATGRCTQYVSPGESQPFEMVELSAGARNGDSGGPILNQRGELAGVLFGTAMGRTAGSYCGRVRTFLTPAMDEFRRLLPNPALVAQNPASPAAPVAPEAGDTPHEIPASETTQRPAVAALAASVHAVPSFPAEPAHQPDVRPPVETAKPAERTPPPAAPPTVAVGSQPATAPPPLSNVELLDDSSTFEQVKNFLAAVGLFTILFHGLRLLAPPAKPSREGSGIRRGP